MIVSPEITQLGASGLFVYLVVKETFGLVRSVLDKKNGKDSRVKIVSFDVCEERHRGIEKGMIRIEKKLDYLTDRRAG